MYKKYTGMEEGVFMPICCQNSLLRSILTGNEVY